MADAVHLRFYEELNDHLPYERRKREFAFPLAGTESVGQILQALNVPASKIELVLVNGSSADLSHRVSAGDRVSLYPVFESLDITPLLRIRSRALRQLRFLVEPGLAPLACSLRALGFDAMVGFPGTLNDEEGRILVTSDPAFLRSGLPRVCLVRETEPREQLNEILSRLDLAHVHS
jgi:hypothetical protein